MTDDGSMTEASKSPAAAVAFEGITPILNVANLEVSVDYYLAKLGFKIDWQDPGIMTSVSRGRCHIMLCEGDQGHPGGWVWIGVEDIEPLFQEFTANGAKVRHPPTNYWWAYEMQIEDPDGNVLRMGSDSKQGQPMGPWLDMRGNTWEKMPDGGWKKTVRG